MTVWVPTDAQVTVNGIATKSTGSKRLFVSHGMRPGVTYAYVVRAEFVRNGQVQQETRIATLVAGETATLTFGNNTLQQVASTQ